MSVMGEGGGHMELFGIISNRILSKTRQDTISVQNLKQIGLSRI